MAIKADDLRANLDRALHVAAVVAKFTTTTLDDEAVTVLLGIVDDDKTWGEIVAVLKAVGVVS
jgi:hypothetical protein